jgi:hypothetical protein
VGVELAEAVEVGVAVFGADDAGRAEVPAARKHTAERMEERMVDDVEVVSLKGRQESLCNLHSGVGHSSPNKYLRPNPSTFSFVGVSSRHSGGKAGKQGPRCVFFP